jgi:hypothetical protein
MIEESRLEALGIIYIKQGMSKEERAEWAKTYNEHIDKIMANEAKHVQEYLF